MEILKQLSIDLSAKQNTSVVYAVQGEKNARKIRFDLFNNGIQWVIDKTASVLVSYKKPDGHGGMYDVLDNGEPAFEFVTGSTNSVIITLAEQVLTTVGNVHLLVSFALEDEILSTFNIILDVSENPGIDVAESVDYFSLSVAIEAAKQVAGDMFDPTKMATIEYVDDRISDINETVNEVKEDAKTFYVKITEQDGVFTADRNITVIDAEYKSGRVIKALVIDNGEEVSVPLIGIIEGDTVLYQGFGAYGNYITISQTDKNISVNFKEIKSDTYDLWFDDETGFLYITRDGQPIGNGVKIPTNGGSSNGAIFELENTTGWSNKTISQEQTTCMISINWSSVEDGVSTGSGTLTVKVENEIRYSANIKQGEYTLNVMEYLILGENRVDVTVTDFRGNSKSILFNVSVYDPAALISTKLVERTLTGDYTNDRVTKIGPEAFASLTLGRLSLPNVTGDIKQAFADLVADEVELASVTSTGYQMVNGSTIGVLRLPNVTTTRSDEDFRAKRVERVVFDRLEVWNKSLRGMYLQVVTFDFHNLKSLPNLPSGGLLSNLIIRTPDVCTLGSTPESTTAKLFVPDDLLADYKSNTNWGVMADRIFAIEDITVDGTVTGEPDSKKMEDIGNV